MKRTNLICVACSECGKNVYRKPYQIKNNKNVFCCRECRSLWLTKNYNGSKVYNYSSILVKCAECGKEFLRQPNQIKRNKNSFCSKSCSDLWRSKNIRGDKVHNYNGGRKPVDPVLAEKRRKTIEIYNSVTKEQLEDMYFNKKMDKKEMGEFFNLNKSATENLLNKYKIPANINPKTGMYYHFKGEILKCDNCNKEFSRSPTCIGDLNFCSAKCFGEYNSKYKVGKNHPNYKKEEYPCPICGKITLMAPSQVKKGRKFCSREHEGLWRSQNSSGEKSCHWKGGYIDDYGWSWPRARRLARKRDNYTCQHCGITEGELIKLNGQKIQVHHLTPYRIFGLEYHEKANKLDNLLCLCPKDHKMYEMEISEIIDAMGEEYAKVLYVYN